MVPLTEHDKYASPTKPRRAGDAAGAAKDPKLKCSVCLRNNVARYYCRECSTAKGAIVAVCGPRTGRNCFSAHAEVA